MINNLNELNLDCLNHIFEILFTDELIKSTHDYHEYTRDKITYNDHSLEQVETYLMTRIRKLLRLRNVCLKWNQIISGIMYAIPSHRPFMNLLPFRNYT